MYQEMILVDTTCEILYAVNDEIFDQIIAMCKQVYQFAAAAAVTVISQCALAWLFFFIYLCNANHSNSA